MQIERSDDPLDKITTSEAIRKLVSAYNRSQYYYAAKEKVDDIAGIVRPLRPPKCNIYGSLSLYFVHPDKH